MAGGGVRVWIVAATVLLAAFGTGARAGQPVDLELVLAIDSSASISGGALEFQLRGHAAALRDPQVAQAIATGPNRAIAVAVVHWASPGSVEVLVPWTRIGSAEDAAALADRVQAAVRPDLGGNTAIGSAIDAIRPLFHQSGFDAPNKVIDLVSNGFSNGGPMTEGARDRAVADGITINALAILDEYDWLEEYFSESVIGGPGAFVRTVETRESFAEAILRKLIDEIVQATPIGRADRRLAWSVPGRKD